MQLKFMSLIIMMNGVDEDDDGDNDDVYNDNDNDDDNASLLISRMLPVVLDVDFLQHPQQQQQLVMRRTRMTTTPAAVTPIIHGTIL